MTLNSEDFKMCRCVAAIMLFYYRIILSFATHNKNFWRFSIKTFFRGTNTSKNHPLKVFKKRRGENDSHNFCVFYFIYMNDKFLQYASSLNLKLKSCYHHIYKAILCFFEGKVSYQHFFRKYYHWVVSREKWVEKKARILSAEREMKSKLLSSCFWGSIRTSWLG